MNRYQRTSKGGVERFHDLRACQCGLGNLFCSGGAGCNSWRHRAEVNRIGDVDDDLARELVAILLDERRGGGIRHGEHNDVAFNSGTTRRRLAYHTLLAGNVAQAQRHADTAVELTKLYALGFLWQYVWSTAGEIALARGEWDSAEAAFERAFEAARAWNNRVHMVNVRVNQALVAQARNKWNRARELLEAARAVFDDAVNPVVRGKIVRVSAELGAHASSGG